MAKKEVIQKFTTGWWNWNAPIYLALGAAVGMTGTMYWKGAHDMAMVMLRQWRTDIIFAFIFVVVLGKIIAENHRTVFNYTTIKAGFWPNFPSFIMGSILLIMALSRFAPGAIKELIKILGDK